MTAHWAVSGATLPTSLATDDLREPILPFSELDRMGWDWIVLGHIHCPQQLADNAFYCGPPATVDWGDAHHDHGVWVIDTDNRTLRFVQVEDRQFVTFDLDSSDGLATTVPVDGAVVRVRYRASRDSRLDEREIVRTLYDQGAWRVFVQPEIERRDRARVKGLDTDIDPSVALDLWLNHHQAANPDAVRAQHARYLELVAR